MATTTSTHALEHFRGELHAPGDERYDAHRALWNGMIDGHPALIARCADAQDVVRALRAAREGGLPCSARGGGHNVAGTATCEGGIVIDLSLMREVDVDPAARTVSAQGGATWGDVDAATVPHGLAVPGGVVSSTGIAGLTLSGGVSWQRRRDGMTIDNLLGAEVVTADGRVLQVDAEHHPDLFWALRGGGGGFGVVTRFTYRAHPLGPDVAHLHVAYPAERAPELLQAYRDVVAGAPDELTADFLLWTLPDVEALPPELRGRPYAGIAGMYAGPVDEGRRALAPLRALGEPLVDLSAEVPYAGLQQAMDPFFPDGSRYFWKSFYLRELTGAACHAFADRHADRPSPRTLLVLRHLGGAIGRVPSHATAFAARDAQFMMSIDSAWDDPAQDARNVDWTRACAADLGRFGTGATYLNFASDLVAEGEGLARATYGSNHERLEQVKRTYDPDDVLGHGSPIRPAASA